MTMKQLVDPVSESTGLTKKSVKNAIEQLAIVVADELKKSGKVIFPGVGTFKVMNTAARPGRNPSTGEPVEIPIGKRVKFKPAKYFKESVL